MTNQEPDHLLRMLQRLENLFFLARGKLKWQKNEVLFFFFFFLSLCFFFSEERRDCAIKEGLNGV